MADPRTFQPPTFDSVEEERRHRKQRLAAAFRLFSRFGFDEGVAGHITARDPEDPHRFWVSPFGTHSGHIKVSDLICVDAEGDVVEGDRPVNTAAFAIPSTLGRLLDPITRDVCAFYREHALFDDYTGVVLDAEAVGKPIFIEPDYAALTQTQAGSHRIGWYSFQPRWDRIVREQPDLLG
ncbi:MAG TPA: class II aldolase/adducin family protein [Streptosporangiaceae bacterium]|nr:class II aldolase/adducin family protein [Streptosporangiaceae bacterium]